MTSSGSPTTSERISVTSVAGDANRANVEGAIEILRTFTIWPLMELLAQDITTQVILRYYQGELRGRFKDIRPINRELQLREEEHQRQQRERL